MRKLERLIAIIGEMAQTLSRHKPRNNREFRALLFLQYQLVALLNSIGLLLLLEGSKENREQSERIKSEVAKTLERLSQAQKEQRAEYYKRGEQS